MLIPRVKGFLENHKLSKHNINLRETATFYEGRLKIDGNVNLLSQHVKNRPVPGGFYMNPLVGLYRFPRGMDITEYKEHFEVWNEERHLNVQNWHARQRILSRIHIGYRSESRAGINEYGLLLPSR